MKIKRYTKRYVVFIFFIQFLIGCAEVEKSEKSVVFDEESQCYIIDCEIGENLVQRNYYVDSLGSHIVHITKYNEGIETHYSFFDNGRISAIAKEKEGKLNGELLNYYESGFLRAKKECQEGEIISVVGFGESQPSKTYLELILVPLKNINYEGITVFDKSMDSSFQLSVSNLTCDSLFVYCKVGGEVERVAENLLENINDSFVEFEIDRLSEGLNVVNFCFDKVSYSENDTILVEHHDFSYSSFEFSLE